jgi:hypothetical protein
MHEAETEAVLLGDVPGAARLLALQREVLINRGALSRVRDVELDGVALLAALGADHTNDTLSVESLEDERVQLGIDVLERRAAVLSALEVETLLDGAQRQVPRTEGLLTHLSAS